jgi:hypothetical protein
MEKSNENMDSLLAKLKNVGNLDSRREQKKAIKELSQEANIIEKVKNAEKYMVEIKRAYDSYALPEFTKILSKYIGETMASMFKDNKIEVEGIEDILYDNDFDALIFQLYYKAAITRWTLQNKWGLMVFVNEKSKTIVKLVQSSQLKYVDNELVECWLTPYEINDPTSSSNATVYRYWLKDGRVHVSLPKRNAEGVWIDQSEIVLKKEIESIPVAFLNNTPMGQSDIEYLQGHFNMIDRLLKSIMDDIDYGKNKVFVSLSAMQSFNGKGNTKQALLEIANSLRDCVISIPDMRNIGLSDSFIPSSGTIQTDKILMAYNMIISFIKEMAFIKTSNGKNGAQETDSQVSMQNLQSNDMTELKQKIRERYLQQIGFHIAKIDYYQNIKNKSITKDIKSPKDINVKIELSQQQQQQLEMSLQNKQASKDDNQVAKGGKENAD